MLLKVRSTVILEPAMYRFAFPSYRGAANPVREYLSPGYLSYRLLPAGKLFGYVFDIVVYVDKFVEWYEF